jgi:hypothetical protein
MLMPHGEMTDRQNLCLAGKLSQHLLTPTY